MGIVRDGVTLAWAGAVGAAMIVGTAVRRRFVDGPGSRCRCGERRSFELGRRWVCDRELHGNCGG